jgi:hypothetical protein
MENRVGLISPPLFYVRWHCRKCGHRNGIARTTVPVLGPETPEHVVRGLLDALRLKLVKVHMRGQHCIATVEDFTLERVEDSQLKKVVGLI